MPLATASCPSYKWQNPRMFFPWRNDRTEYLRLDEAAKEWLSEELANLVFCVVGDFDPPHGVHFLEESEELIFCNSHRRWGCFAHCDCKNWLFNCFQCREEDSWTYGELRRLRPGRSWGYWWRNLIRHERETAFRLPAFVLTASIWTA